MKRLILKPKKHHQQGLTLVEIMVAVAISLVLVAGVIQIFLSNKATYRLQEGLGRMQENARFALNFITSDLRQAGYLGCAPNSANVVSRLNSPPASFTPLAGVQGWEFTGTGPGQTYDINPTDVTPTSTNGGNWVSSAGAVLDQLNALDGSDILRVWYTEPVQAQILNVNQGIPITVDLTTTNAIDDGDFVVISDCGNPNLVQVCNVGIVGSNTQLSINTTGNRCIIGNNLGGIPPLNTLVGQGEVSVLHTGVFYIGKQGNDPTNPPSLYFVELNRSDTGGDNGTLGTSQELVQGVDSMQILYGLDNDGDRQVNRYVTADNVPDWQNVVAVQLALLMNTVTEADVQSHGGIYSVNGTNLNIVTQERRPRKIYSSTIQLRNRSS